VAANRRLRQRLAIRCQELGLTWRVAPMAYCTDNAAMIGVAATRRFASGFRSSTALGVAARLPLEHADLLYGPAAEFSFP